MTRPLSPAAQAVRAAAVDTYFNLDDINSDTVGAIAAAALRAAVNATQQRQYNDCYICDASKLRAIANELDPRP